MASLTSLPSSSRAGVPQDFALRAPQNGWARLPARPAVVCAVSGGPKSTGAAKRTMVMKADDPLAKREYRPAMPGDEVDFWEGSRWDLLGFILEYLWAFGILLAIVASIYAVSSYSTDEAPTPSTVIDEIAKDEKLAGELTSFDVEDDAPPL